jgi:hypothetical protein
MRQTKWIKSTRLCWVSKTDSRKRSVTRAEPMPSLWYYNKLTDKTRASSHKWGREFRVSGQAIRKKYPDYTYKHNQTLYNDMVKEYAAADHVWVLCEAPAPSDEQANQVGAFGGQLAALQCAFDNCKESAFSVDEESVISKKKEKKKKKKKDDDSRRGRTKHRSKSRGRSISTDDRKVTNKGKHCKENQPHAGKHDKEKCFYNKKVQRMASQQNLQGIGSHLQTPTRLLFSHGRICKQRIRRQQQWQRQWQWHYQQRMTVWGLGGWKMDRGTGKEN